MRLPSSLRWRGPWHSRLGNSSRSTTACSPGRTARRGGQAQRAMALDVGFQQAGGQQLPEHAAPLPRIEFGADAMGAEGLMAELADLGGIGAAQHVDQVRCAEALAGAVHAGQGLLRRDGGIPVCGGSRQLSQLPQLPACASPKHPSSTCRRQAVDSQ